MEYEQNFEAFLDCWQNLPRSSHTFLPSKRDCTPKLMGALMANIALLRYKGPYQLDLVFSGSEIERLSGLNKNVRNYYDMVTDKKTREALNAYHTIIMNQPCGAYVADMVSTPSNNNYVFETMQFPLSDDTGDVCFLLVYGYGRRPAETDTERSETDRKLGHIRDMHFIDLGASAPHDCIVDYHYKKG